MIFTWKLTISTDWDLNKKSSTFLLYTSHSYFTTFQNRLHMDFLDRVKDLWQLYWSRHLKNLQIAFMNLYNTVELTAYSGSGFTQVNSFLHFNPLMTFTRLQTLPWITQRVTCVDQKLYSHSEHRVHVQFGWVCVAHIVFFTFIIAWLLSS